MDQRFHRWANQNRTWIGRIELINTDLAWKNPSESAQSAQSTFYLSFILKILQIRVLALPR
jgi:hypothetical protein